MLYACNDLIRPDLVVELSWRHGLNDFSMPYMINMLAQQTKELAVLKADNEARKAKEKETETTEESVPILGGGRLMITAGGGGGRGGDPRRRLREGPAVRRVEPVPAAERRGDRLLQAHGRAARRQAAPRRGCGRVLLLSPGHPAAADVGRRAAKARSTSAA